MYYSYKCTYCGRLFYTYSTNKEAASHILYKTIKQHLIDYDEDKKEYEMDDGEAADSDQIYYEMSQSAHLPPGGYKATFSEKNSGAGSDLTIFYIILFLLLIGVILFFFFGKFELTFPQF
ncbi:hypothetical protein HZA75_07600 [Candidatus Roizmanbacteria bacterium]|nr:hypothetical protein [Candidatus Roizmanbacteria bacterium]